MEFLQKYSILLSYLQLSLSTAEESYECGIVTNNKQHFSFESYIKKIILADFPSEVYNIKSTHGTQSRIYDGTKASGPLPYQVQILVYKQHLCGGTLISPNHVLTARHCLVRQKSFFKFPSFYIEIRVGSNERYEKVRFCLKMKKKTMINPSSKKM